MLYPRVTTDNKLVTEKQMVGVREHLASKRVFFLSGVICNEVESQNLLLALDSISHEPIKMVIASPGGDLDSTFLLYDTMKLIKSPIWTLGRYCMSAAALLLAAGDERYLLPHARVMLHLPSGQLIGDAREWEIQQAEMQKYKDRIVSTLVDCGAKKSYSEILRDIDRQFWLDPEEAIEYGLADKVLNSKVLEGWLG